MFARYQTKSHTQPEKQIKLMGNRVKWKEMPEKGENLQAKGKKRERERNYRQSRS